MKYDEKYMVKSLNWKTNKETVSINCKVFIYFRKELTGGVIVVHSLLSKITTAQKPT